MIYLSLFHGIGAVDVAWLPLGWKCAGYAEIELFPIAVTKHHHPDIPNLGDVTKITDEQIAALGPIDLVVGGSPCQDLSVAGKRAGLAGERSGLFHEQMRIFNAARTLCGARWLLWENVPGAFSTHGGRDFGVVVGSMAGSDFAVPRGGWGTCGAAIGPNGLVEWRVLDAQYVRVQSHPAAVPQRRRRVFALLDSGNWADRPPAFLEPEGLCGHPAPRREAGERTASRAGCGFEVGGALGPRVSRLTTAECAQGAAIVAAIQGAAGRENPDSGPDGIGIRTDGAAYTLEARAEVQMVAHSLRAEGFDASEDGTGRGTPLIPAVCGTLSDGAHMGGGSTARTPIQAESSPLPQIAMALCARDAKGADSDTKTGHLIPVGGGFDAPVPFDTTQVTSKANRSTPRAGDPSHPLAAHAHAPAIAFSCKDHGADAGEVPPTLRSMDFDATHANGGGQVAVAFKASHFTRGKDGAPDEVTPPLSADADKGDQDTLLAAPWAFGWQNSSQQGASASVTPTLDKSKVPGLGVGMQVRRLTPVECEKLQGFPPGYTAITVRGKPAADGPRYKALGNSMAVNVMRWIGERIAAVEQAKREELAA